MKISTDRGEKQFTFMFICDSGIHYQINGDNNGMRIANQDNDQHCDVTFYESDDRIGIYRLIIGACLEGATLDDIKILMSNNEHDITDERVSC